MNSLQFFHLGRLLGLEGCRPAMIILGSTFDVKDILCYFLGFLLIAPAENILLTGAERNH